MEENNKLKAKFYRNITEFIIYMTITINAALLNYGINKSDNAIVSAAIIMCIGTIIGIYHLLNNADVD